MDDRLKQIKEGAGLDESRLNQEFVDALKKYSTPVLVVLAIVAGIYVFYVRRERQRAVELDQSLVQFDSAFESKAPTSLQAVAESAPDYSGAKSMALLALGDIHLEEFRTGVPSGTQLTGDGAIQTEGGKFLTQPERDEKLREAERAYQRVVDLTQSDADRRLQYFNALAGLAAVEEAKGQLDAAKISYTRIADLAEKQGYPALAATMRRFAESTGALKDAPRLYNASELASATAPAVPFTTGLQGIQARDAQGNPINVPGLTPIAPPGSATPIAPAPTPAPSPAPQTPPASEPATEPTAEPAADPAPNP